MNKYEFRYKKFVTELGAFEQNGTNRELDKYDFLGRSRDKYVKDRGYVRIIVAADKPFAQFVEMPVGVRAGEISRLVSEDRATTRKLFRFIAWTFFRRDISVICALMDPLLLAGLKRNHGITFDNIGDPVDFHGVRVPVWDYRGVIFRRFVRFTLCRVMSKFKSITARWW